MFQSLMPFHRNRHVTEPVERNSGDSFFRLQHEMNRLFDDAFAGFGLPSALGAAAFSSDTTARINVRETNDTIEVEAELPGVAEDDIDVQIVDNLPSALGAAAFSSDTTGRSVVKSDQKAKKKILMAIT